MPSSQPMQSRLNYLARQEKMICHTITSVPTMAFPTGTCKLSSLTSARRTRPDLEKWWLPQHERSQGNAHFYISPTRFIRAALLYETGDCCNARIISIVCQVNGKEHSMKYPTFYRTTQIDGLSIFYREAGPKDAPTILLLHGLPSSSRMFEPLFTRLSDRYHLVAPDYPGFGHSDWPDPKKFAYTFDHIAEIMNHFTEALGLSHFTLYMQDYGGPVGFRMILAHPDRVEALIVQDAVAHNTGLGENWKTRRAFWNDRAPNESALRTNLLSLATTKARHAGDDPNVERHNPDLWIDEFYFLNRPGQADIQSDLFYDYRTNVDSYPKWQAWMREKQPRLLVIWGQYESSFDPSEPESYRRDVPKAEVHIVDGGHFALDTAADEIAALVQGFVSSSREGFPARRAG
jgi:pimeloyl-ACP methyl ester carboxylesterase